jgi:hypothetical protein
MQNILLLGGDSSNLNIVLRSVSTHVSKSFLSSKMFAKHQQSLDLMNSIFLRIILLFRPRWHSRDPLLKTLLNRLNIG